MKKWIYLLLLSIFFGQLGHAFEAKQVCVTEPMTSSFVVYPENADFLTVRIIHHNGAGYGPIHMGIITANDLPLLNQRAQILKSLGSELDLQMSAKNCEFFDDFNFSCFGYGKTSMINGKNVRLWSVYSYQIFEKSFAGKYDYVAMNANIDVDGESYNVSMKYAIEECTNQFDSFTHKLLANKDLR